MSTKTRRQQIEEMLADDPNDAFLRYGLAMEFVSVGDDAGAIRCFQDLFQIDPTYVPAYHQAGQAFVRLNRVPEARDILQKGIDQARKQGNMHTAEEMEALLASIA